MTRLLLVHLAATWYMTGVIWHAQIVSYPAFGQIDPARFPAFQTENILRTAVVVVGPMVVELGSGLMLARRLGPGRARRLLGWSLAALAVVWLVTILDVAPTHVRLAGEGYSAVLHERVLSHNWARTAGWSLRALLLFRAARLAYARAAGERGRA